MREENYNPRIGAYFTALSGERNKFPPFGSCLGAWEENYNPRIGAYFTALSGERNKFPPFGSCLGAYVVKWRFGWL